MKELSFERMEEVNGFGIFKISTSDIACAALAGGLFLLNPAVGVLAGIGCWVVSEDVNIHSY